MFIWHGTVSQIFNKKNFNINLEITKKINSVFESNKYKKNFISGSCFEYGDVNGEISENHKLKFKKNTLGEYKIKLENMLFKIQIKKFFGKNILCIWTESTIRIFNTLCYQMLKRKQNFDLKKPFDARDYIHVDDVSSAIISIVKKGNPRIYNIGNGSPVLNYNILEKIYSNFNKNNEL